MIDQLLNPRFILDIFVFWISLKTIRITRLFGKHSLLIANIANTISEKIHSIDHGITAFLSIIGASIGLATSTFSILEYLIASHQHDATLIGYAITFLFIASSSNFDKIHMIEEEIGDRYIGITNKSKKEK